MMRFLTRFRRDERGNVAMIVAITAMVLVTLVAGGLEFGRVYATRTMLQSALDSATLATAKYEFDRAKSVPAIEAELAAFGQRFIDANKNASAQAVTLNPLKVQYTPSPDPATPEKITLTLTGTMNTSFLRSLGMKPISVTLISASEPPQNPPVELVLVLDVTSSMNQPPASGGEIKLATLKRAANDLVNNVMMGGRPNVKVGVVPYSGYVNYGLDDGIPEWLLPVDRFSTTCTQFGPIQTPMPSASRAFITIASRTAY